MKEMAPFVWLFSAENYGLFVQASGLSFWPALEQGLGIAVAILLVLVLILIAALALLLLRGVWKRTRRRRLREKLLALVGRAVHSPFPDEALEEVFAGGARTFSKTMLKVLSEVYEEATGAEKHTVRSLILRMGYGEYVRNEIYTSNTGTLIHLIRLVGELDLVGLEDRVAAILYSRPGAIELQYQCFLTLAQLGSEKVLLSVLRDDSFVQRLSFRSLQEILKNYKGNKAVLFEKLLDAPDPLVVRICIKRIGLEGLSSLAGSIYPFLFHGNADLAVDAARSMGQLKYRKAAPALCELLQHERWEVRAIAAVALGEVDSLGDHQPQLVGALCDHEWQVRYNAALALASHSNAEEIEKQVASSGDQYAREILAYMRQAASLRLEGGTPA